MQSRGQETPSEKLNGSKTNLQDALAGSPGDRPVSSASSQTTIPVMPSGTQPSIDKIDKEKSAVCEEPSDDGHRDPDVDEVEQTGGLQREELEKAHKRSTLQSIILVATVTIGMILNISSSSSASISLPSIGRAFNEPEDSLQWVVSAYSLSSGCLLIFFGRLADLYGRKKAFMIGTVWLGVFSLGCGFANNINALFILRGLQGIGPAATVPASLGILAHSFPPSRARSIAFATFSAGAPVGGAIGMQIGGILVEWAPATWRAPFFLAAGLSVLVLLGSIFFIDADLPSTERDKRVDWFGAILVTSALCLITFVLGEGELAPKRWNTPYIIALLVIGIVLLGLFIVWQWFLEHDQSGKWCPPLMKLSLWTRARGKFAATQSIAFFEWAAFLSWQFWAQLYYQDYEGLSPILTAVRLLPMTVVGIACNVFVAAVVGHIPFVILVSAGTLLTACAGLLFAVIIPSAPYWAFGFPASILSVFGADFVFACGTIFVAKVSLPHEQSLAGGLFQTLTQLGTALGLASTTIVHNTVLRQKADQPGVDAQLDAYKAAQWMTFALGATGSLVAVLLLRGVGPVGHRASIKAVAAEKGREQA
ncbi:hypothetical protein ACEPAI_6643 [Sanghuangporus weigelae]